MKNLSHFVVPDQKAREAALGSLAKAPKEIKNALSAIIPLFKPVPKPSLNDWLANHNEEGQSYNDYVSEPKNYVDKKRKVIYVQPLEESIDKEFVEKLRKFTQAFYFGLEVKVLPYFDVQKQNIGHRINEWSGKLQYNASNILRNIEKKLPADAFCMIGICLTDLYPRDEWNFVFGLASIRNRTGVFSFARYQESFYEEKQTKNVTDNSKLIWRSSKVMVHEIGHMFGIGHCIYYSCVMNGTNHLEENDNRPIFLCPVCLRKLQHNIGFGILERFEALKKVSYELGGMFQDAGKWCEKAIQLIQDEDDSEKKMRKEF